MTIKDLEQKTGMARANIRFYEGEGLLSPKRLDNGYRDYSEEDARTLEKIRLLRQIGLDIDTIRKVQGGALTLEQALFVQQTRLEGDKVVLDRAAEICRELEASGVEYGALDPKPYLARLEAPASKPVLTPPSPAFTVPMAKLGDACWHPWQRFFARSLDMTLYDTIFNVAWLVIFRDQNLILLQAGNAIAQWVLALISLAFTLAVEPLWLHFWGWTPGKWLFGLKLRDKDGEKLSLSQGWERSRTLAWEGYGWNLPIYDLYRLWKGRKDALDGWSGHWNSDYAFRYTKEDRRYSGWIYVGVNVLCIVALFLGLRYAQLPVNRGDLTVAEFARNYNHFRAQLSQNAVKGPELGKDGRWAGPTDEYQPGGTVRMEVDGVWVAVEDPVWDEPEFTVEDGRVTAVTIRVSGDGCLDGIPITIREELAMLALSGATGDWGLLHSDLGGWAAAADDAISRTGNQDTQFRGLHTVQATTLAGYEEDTAVFLTPILGERQYFERVTTISLVE